ncbi:MAG: hypothetical protein AB9860_08495 [Methanomassiliicoccales archaeon]
MLTSMALLLSAFTIVGSNVSAIEGPALWTDKPDYWPNEIVLVYGSGFEPYSQIDIPVIRPDSTIVIGDGSFTPGWDTVTINGDGMLAYEYQLDGILGLYEVRAYSSPWSGDTGEIPLVSVTFTDAPPSADIDQLKNGAASDPTSPGDWVNGNLNEQGAHYVEGYSIPYRCVMENMPLGIDIVLTIEYDIKHSDRHAIDYLTYYDRMNDPLHSDVFGHTSETINPLQDVTGVSATIGQYTIPAPTSVGSPVPGQPTQSYNDLVAAEGIAAVQMTLFGGTISNIAYGPQGDLTDSQSAQQVMITFELDSETAVLSWGGHIGSRLDWGFDLVGDPLSAGGISGSPYHMRLIAWYSPDLPENKNLPNLGNQDRSLNAVAVYFAPPGQICVFKYEDMNLNGEYDAGDVPLIWHITVYNETMVMMAEGDTNATGWVCFDLPAGTYYVSEASDPDYIGIENGTGTVMVILDASEEEQVFFGNAEKGSICGTKYEDLDGSSTINAGDGVIEAWGVYLYMWDGDSYEPLDSTTTAADGSYCFEGLDPREMYAVYEENRAGWAEIINEHEDLEFTSSGQQLTDNDFLNFELIDITVCKLEDLTGDGETVDDDPLEGWTLSLWWKALPGDDWSKVGNDVQTGADGCYTWADLGPGYYEVRESVPAGWTATSATTHNFGLVTSGHATYEFTFTNFENVTISVCKLEDLTGDGEGIGDLPIEGWEVYLYWKATVGGVYIKIDTQETGADGCYEWTDLGPGYYKVGEETPEGWTPNSATEHEFGLVTSGTVTYEFTFLNIEYGSICVFKYEDVNGNGEYDAGDAPIEGWHIYVEHESYAVPNVDGFTDENGWFCVLNVIPGTYWVYEYMDPDWMAIENGSGNSIMVVITSGDEEQVIFGNAKLISVCGAKFEDVDLNGWSAADEPIEGWQIDLYGYVDWDAWDSYDYAIHMTTDTDELGEFCFEGLNPFWIYDVYEEDQIGWMHVSDPYDYEGMVSTGSGMNITGVDFLNAQLGCISGYKYKDVDLSSTINAGDTIVASWIITLKMWNGDSYETVTTDTTDYTGKYEFCGLNPYKTYAVYEELMFIWTEVIFQHEGLVFTSSGQTLSTGTDFLNALNIDICGYKLEDTNLDGVGDVGIEDWRMDLWGYPNDNAWWHNPASLHMVSFTDEEGYYCFINLNPYWIYDVYEEERDQWTQSGIGNPDYWFIADPDRYWYLEAEDSDSDIEDVNFTNARNLTICAYKWEDVDLDKTISVGDQPVEGWCIHLFWWNDLLGDNGGWSLYDFDYTDGEGKVCFCDLNPYLNYSVGEVWQYAQSVDEWTPASPLMVELVSGVDFESGDIVTVDFLNAKNLDICGYKFEDTYLDGWGGDDPVEGWWIYLYAYETYEDWLVFDYIDSASTQTDEFGNYCFEGLNPYWIYDVEEELRSDWTPYGPTYHWGLMAEESGDWICNVNFLNAENGDICGHKYWDKNADGIFNGEDVPLSGWTVNLYKWGGSSWVFVAQDLTDAGGVWCFENLNPYLTYKVEEVLQAGWVPINPDTGIFEPITFCASGQTASGYDFMNTLCGPDGKTIGFWSTNVGKNLKYIKGKAQVSKDDLSTYLTNIYNKYYVTEMYTFDFLYFPGGWTANQKLQKAWEVLTVPDNAVMQDKAEAQILALLLTEQWKGADYSNAFAYIPGCITGHGAVMGTMSNIILHILDHYEAGEFMQAKNEADFLNNLPYSMYWCP